jgi:hypothetical protein
MSEAMNAQGTPGAATEAGKEQTSQTQSQTEAGATDANGAANGMTKEEAREAIRKLKIKHQDGVEEEVPEDEVLRIYRERKGHQKAANKELQEGKALKKQNEQLIQALKDKGTLFQALEKLGHNPRALAEELLAQQLEEETMDPRERELKKAQQKLREYEELDKRQKEAAQKAREAELKKKFSDDYSAQFIDALKESNLPPTKTMVAEMAKYIHRAAKINFQMTAKEAAKLVKEDIENAHRKLYGDVDAETLVKLLGDGGLQKIRQYETSKLKDPMANLKTPTEQGEPGQRQRSKTERMSEAEWRMYNRK